MSDELDRFLEEEISKDTKPIVTHGDRVVAKAESEFVSYTAEYKDRLKEKDDIKAEITKLKKKISKCRNVKNFRLREVNKKRAEKRAEYKKLIEFYELRLREIKIEEDQVADDIKGDVKDST